MEKTDIRQEANRNSILIRRQIGIGQPPAAPAKPEIWHKPKPESTTNVSILVVLDDWFGQPIRDQLMREARVSILVVLDDWFGRPQECCRDGILRVSILVVLDDWFGPRVLFDELAEVIRFNPCCFG